MQFAINKAIHILSTEHFIRAHIVTALFKYLDTIIKFKLLPRSLIQYSLHMITISFYLSNLLAFHSLICTVNNSQFVIIVNIVSL